MDIYLGYLIKTIVLPPTVNFCGLLLAGLMRSRARLFSRLLFWASMLSLVALSLPAVAGLLAALTERYPPLDPRSLASLRASTVVILAGGRDTDRVEYGGDTLSPMTLERVRYGAFVARHSKLPVAVSGGVVSGDGTSEATLMAQALENEFAVDVSVIEGASRNTAENARYTAELLDHKRIVLITHALHMRRAVRMFEQQGFDVVPAPIDHVGLHEFPVELFDWLPSAGALVISRYAIHEWLGTAWYSLRY